MKTITDQIRRERRLAVEDRNINHRALPIEEKLAKLESRPGNSKRETSRIALVLQKVRIGGMPRG